jgi:signal peptidase II
MRELKVAFYLFLVVFTISQVAKYGFAHFDWNVAGPVMSLHLAYNYGVAFSMFSFLAEYLKYIQLLIVAIGTIYLYKNPDVFKDYHISIGLLYAGGLSNILDRFTYGGVVDFFYWHYGFEFAIFNFADVIINIAIALIFYKQYKQYREEKKQKA